MKIEKKYVIYGLVVILILVMSVSLAYFQTKIVGDKKNVTVNTKDLKVVYTDGDGVLSGSIEPGYTTTKAFTVENKTDSTYEYDIVIKDLVNTFVTSGFLQYKITSSDGYNMTEYKDIPKSSTATDTVLAYSVSIEANTTHTYTLSIVYNDSETVDQSDDMGKTLSGKLYIGEGTDAPPTLASAMLRDNPTVSTRSDFSSANVASTTGTIYKTTSTEDDSTVYYYSGNTTNNWVKFGGFYWRIIRTNEDASVRLLYAGTNPNLTNAYIGTSSFNTSASGSTYVGYMYGGSSSLDDNRGNTNSSTIKTYLDDWYKNNLLDSYDIYISKSAIYCNDRSIQNNSWFDTTGGAYYYYGAYVRQGATGSYSPSYKCNADTSGRLFESTQADKFSVNTSGGGNGQLTYPIALMTADEVAFAGGNNATDALTYVAINSEGTSLFTEGAWWTLSPTANTYGNVMGYRVTRTGALDMNPSVSNEHYVRPVISISSCAKVTGTGTATNPYIINETASTC